MNPPGRRPVGSQSSPSSRLQRPSAGSGTRRLGAPASSPGTQRLGRPQPAPASGGFRGAPPPQKKDNTAMYAIGGAVALLLVVGAGFAMMGGKEPPPKPKVIEPVKPPEAKPKEYDKWEDPAMLGSETEAAKRRAEGLKEQNKTGEVDRTKVGTDGK